MLPSTPHESAPRAGVRVRAQDARQPADAPARLAHELANLLDGSLRNLSLAMARLRDHPPGELADGGVLDRLEATSQALGQMVRLIRPWNGPAGRRGLPAVGMSLEQAVAQAVALLQPLAAAEAVRMETDLTREAAGLPGEALYPVLINALRNSLESIAARRQAASGGGGGRLAVDSNTGSKLPVAPAPGTGSKLPVAPDAQGGESGRVVVAAAVEGDTVAVRVRDNGLGVDPRLRDPAGRLRFGVTTRPGGSGLGLLLAREVAERLEGSVTLEDLPQGAQFVLRYPRPRGEGRP